MTPVVIALGANLGDAHAALREAVAALPGAGVVVRAVSSVYQTDPVGGPEQPVYLNAVVVGETALDPEALLRALQRIEDEHGRTREVRWGPRTLDLDIISLGGLTMSEDHLTVPHPRAAERGFVLIPWLEIDPQAQLPDGRRVADLAAACDSGAVRRSALGVTGPGTNTDPVEEGR